MMKYLFSLSLCITYTQVIYAQSDRDTIMYFVKNPNIIVADKENSDYTLLIFPKGEGDELYPVLEYYSDGKRKLIASTRDKTLPIVFNGPYMEFYPNGKRKMSVNFVDGQRLGDEVVYYPNGKIYTLKKFEKDYYLMTECRDSVGSVLASDGNGKWVEFNDDFSAVYEKGEIRSGKPVGKWVRYTSSSDSSEIFDKNNAIFQTPQLIKVDVQPEFPGGLTKFSTFLKFNINYPYVDKIQNVTGKVFVSFIVESDGSITNVEAIRGPSETLKQEAVRVLKLSPKWHPGSAQGKPVRVQYTLPVDFSLIDR